MSLWLSAYWIASFALILAFPELLEWLVLWPGRVVEHREYWRLFTYGLFPINLGTLVFLVTTSIWFGRYLEPAMGRRRYLSIYVVPSVVCAVLLTVVVPETDPPLPYAGAYQTASGVLAVFTAWSIAWHRQLPRNIYMLWLVAAWVLYSVIRAPASIAVTYLVVWSVALSLALPSLRRRVRASAR